MFFQCTVFVLSLISKSPSNKARNKMSPLSFNYSVKSLNLLHLFYCSLIFPDGLSETWINADESVSAGRSDLFGRFKSISWSYWLNYSAKTSFWIKHLDFCPDLTTVLYVQLLIKKITKAFIFIRCGFVLYRLSRLYCLIVFSLFMHCNVCTVWMFSSFTHLNLLWLKANHTNYFIFSLCYSSQNNQSLQFFKIYTKSADPCIFCAHAVTDLMQIFLEFTWC